MFIVWAQNLIFWCKVSVQNILSNSILIFKCQSRLPKSFQYRIFRFHLKIYIFHWLHLKELDKKWLSYTEFTHFLFWNKLKVVNRFITKFCLVGIVHLVCPSFSRLTFVQWFWIFFLLKILGHSTPFTHTNTNLHHFWASIWSNFSSGDAVNTHYYPLYQFPESVYIRNNI